MSVTGGIMAGIGLAGSIGGAAIGASAAGNAAATQASAAEQGQQLQAKEAADALAFQEKQWNTQQANMAPWLQTGKASLQDLFNLIRLSEGPNPSGPLAPFTQQFAPPTAVTETNDPGYQFRLQQGEGALENSAAANGSLLSGNTLEAQQKFGQNYASNEYSNVYNRALQQYQQKYGIFENNQTNLFNRLAALSGVGQTAATSLGSEGQAAANNIGSIDLTTGAQQGQQLNNAAAATASGYIGGANAWGGALGGSTNNLMNLYLMQQLFGGGGGAATAANPAAVPGMF